IGLLERRLDAEVFRAKFVATVFAARQFISHGHIRVNGHRVIVPRYRVEVGDVVEVQEKATQLALVPVAAAVGARDVPAYDEVDGLQLTGTLAAVAVLADVAYAVHMEPHLVVQYYSRSTDAGAGRTGDLAPVRAGSKIRPKLKPCQVRPGM